MFDDLASLRTLLRAVGTRRLLAGTAGLVGLALAGQFATHQVTVRPGDTLSAIAQQQGSSVAILSATNGIADPNLIIAGQVLAVPASTGDVAYTVRPGDSLSHVAKIFGSSVPAIVSRNHLTDADHIVAGQTLLVPLPAPATPPATTPPVTTPPVTTTPAPAAPATTAAVTTTTPAPTTTTSAPATTTAPVTTTVPPAVSTPAIPGAAGGGVVSTVWVVQPGDTLASIGARFGISAARLGLLNAIGQDEPLVAGQRIFIPAN